jgi:NAD(P)H-hydrate epimerase
LAEKATAVVLGCGIGTHPETREFVTGFVRRVGRPMVIDADGLNCLAQDAEALKGRHCDPVLTPHPGEMARLLGTTSAEVQSNRIGAAKEAASRFGSVIVLKGTRTVIADPSGRAFINPTGNSGMASGGTGDVLAGAIGGLLAQGLSPLDAAVCGVYIHGRAGDIAAETLGEAGMIAGDVLRALPLALKEMHSKH